MSQNPTSSEPKGADEKVSGWLGQTVAPEPGVTGTYDFSSERTGQLIYHTNTLRVEEWDVGDIQGLAIELSKRSDLSQADWLTLMSKLSAHLHEMAGIHIAKSEEPIKALNSYYGPEALRFVRSEIASFKKQPSAITVLQMIYLRLLKKHPVLLDHVKTDVLMALSITTGFSSNHVNWNMRLK